MHAACARADAGVRARPLLRRRLWAFSPLRDAPILSLDKILQIMQAASKRFHRESDRYRAMVLYYNPFVPIDFVKVARISMTPAKPAPLIKLIKERLGVAPSEDGRLAFKSYTAIVQELLSQDPGSGSMPELPFFSWRPPHPPARHLV
eukprot:798691-Pleurochrysis_carterae.AAC.3